MTEGKMSERQLVVFRLAKEEYGLPISQVKEINRLAAITKLPQAPDFVEGIINLRGAVIAVIDLRKRFSLPQEAYGEDSRIIIVETKGQTVGIIVDAVTEVLRLPEEDITPPPPSFILDARYIHGVGKVGERLIILLDIDEVLTAKEQIALRDMALAQ